VSRATISEYFSGRADLRKGVFDAGLCLLILSDADLEGAAPVSHLPLAMSRRAVPQPDWGVCHSGVAGARAEPVAAVEKIYRGVHPERISATAEL